MSDSASGSQFIPVFGTGSDFQISATPFSPATIVAGNSATSTIMVNSLGGFSSSVSLSCTSGLATGISCSFNPATVAASSNGTATSTLTVNTLQSTPPSAYSLTVAGTSNGLSNSASQALTVQAPQPASFSLASTSSGSASVTPGQNANFALSATSAGGFTGTVSLTCSVGPTPSLAPTCNVPASVQVGSSSPGSFSVTVATTAKTSAQLWLTKDLENSWAALMSSGLLVLVFALVPAEPGKKRKKYLLAALVICSIVFPGCGGGSNGGGGGGASGTPSGSYTITVTGTSGSIKQTSTLKLTVQ